MAWTVAKLLHAAKLRDKARIKWKCLYWDCKNRTTRPKFCCKSCADKFHNRAVLTREEFVRLGGIGNPIYAAFRKKRSTSDLREWGTRIYL